MVRTLTCPKCSMIDFEMTNQGKLKCVHCGMLVTPKLTVSKTQRKIYIASSWKNANLVREIAMCLRSDGHEVFDFTDPNNSVNGIPKFVFSAAQWAKEGGKPACEIEWKDFLSWHPSKKAFVSDKAGLDWADTVLLINPSGRSSHLEAGYGAGKGKDVFIFGNLPLGEFDAMYGFAEGNCYRESEYADMMLHLKGVKRTLNNV